MSSLKLMRTTPSAPVGTQEEIGMASGAAAPFRDRVTHSSNYVVFGVVLCTKRCCSVFFFMYILSFVLSKSHMLERYYGVFVVRH